MLTNNLVGKLRVMQLNHDPDRELGLHFIARLVELYGLTSPISGGGVLLLSRYAGCNVV